MRGYDNSTGACIDVPAGAAGEPNVHVHTQWMSGCQDGSTIQLAMNVESFNGLECWRLLVQREEPSVGSDHGNSLVNLQRRSQQVRGGAQNARGCREEVQSIACQMQ